MSVTIELDFTGHTPAGAGIGYLETGLHSAQILEFRHYEDSNRLLVYMITEGVRHKDSFSLNPKAMPFLMGFLVSAGVPEGKLKGKTKFPFDKLAGKTVYFNYTAPNMGANGRPVDGSYPDYRYINENYFNQMKKAQAAPAPANFVVEPEKTVANGAPAAPVATTSSDDDFEFLMQ
tara:strand:- start:692 stop:1219 length:528 start_codon:yes stop_codon:yes gene_type:complete